MNNKKENSTDDAYDVQIQTQESCNDNNETASEMIKSICYSGLLQFLILCLGLNSKRLRLMSCDVLSRILHHLHSLS